MSTGLDYFGFRYYDPVLGKFITRDPSGYPDGPNNYLYVSNNPINNIDPLGLQKHTTRNRGGYVRTLNDAANVAAGFGDTISLGMTEKGRQAMGTNDTVDKNGPKYKTGQDLAKVHDAATTITTGGGAAALKELSKEGVKQAIKNEVKSEIKSEVSNQVTDGLINHAAENGHISESTASNLKDAKEIREALKTGGKKKGSGAGTNKKKQTAVEREKRVVQNKRDGTRREKEVAQDLHKNNPGATVNNERMLLDSNGKKVVDPITGTGRRVDHVVTKDGKAVDVVETTSLTADKKAQMEKEQRIRDTGGTYIKEKKTKNLVNIKDVDTRIENNSIWFLIKLSGTLKESSRVI